MAQLEVALDLDGLEHLLARQFGVATGLVDHLLGGRDAAGLPVDLADVADPRGEVGGPERADVIAFKLGVGRDRRRPGSRSAIRGRRWAHLVVPMLEMNGVSSGATR
jgi:hypothetical protein